MATMTLIEMIQDIMSDTDSDAVNSLDDTVESQQVAQIIKTTYFEILGNRDWPHLKTLLQLTASGDSSKPTHMSMTTDIRNIDWIKYNKIKSGGTKDIYLPVKYLEQEEFLKLLNSRDSSASTTKKVTDDSSLVFLIRNDTAPTYWTSFDDENIIFDSYDSAVDTTLQMSKTQVYGQKEPTWTHTDNTTPDLPSQSFPMFLAEAKSTVFNTLRQVANQKEEQKATRQRRWSARKNWKTKKGIPYDTFGRKGKK